MYTQSTSRLLAAAAVAVAFGMFAVPALSEERVTGSEVPANSYYGDKLSQDERAGIASEEDVSPNDGKASVPPSDLQGVIPDAADPEKGDTTVAVPPDDALPGDVDTKGSKSTGSEANVIIDDSKKNFRVSRKEFDECVSQWGPDTQMTKEEWSSSCRTTLQYFPEGQ
jgi:hypothetical protein